MKMFSMVCVLLVATTAQGQECSKAAYREVNGHSILDYGVVGYPMHGWVGLANTGTAVPGVTIQAYAADGKVRMATTTSGNAGEFSFPKLKEGKYLLKIRAKSVSADEPLVRVSKRSSSVVCLVAEAQAPAAEDEDSMADKSCGESSYGACFRIHGRFTAYTADGQEVLWPVGTHRLLRSISDNKPLYSVIMGKDYGKHSREFDEMAARYSVMGNFVVCPREEDTPGAMRNVCIKSGDHLRRVKRND